MNEILKASEVRRVSPFIGGRDGRYYALPKFDNAPQTEDGIYIPQTPVVDHLHDAGASDVYINQVFSPNSELVGCITQEFDLNTHSLPEINVFIGGTAETPMHLINPSIAGPEQDVKNNHDLRHAMRVAGFGDGLMEQVGTPMWQRKAGMVALLLHDIGNIFGREPHALFSTLVWRKFYPNMKMTPEQEYLVDQAIVHHDGDGFYDVIRSWDEPTIEGVFARMRETYEDPALALIMGDKADIGFDRLPSKDREDVHQILNLYGETDSLSYTEDLENLYWVIDFGRDVTEGQQRSFPHFVVRRSDGNIVRKTPKLLKNGHEDLGVESVFEEWLRLFWATYYPRNMLLVMAGFALNPMAKQVTILVRNLSDVEPGKSINFYTFSRDEQSPYYVAKRMKKIYEILPDTLKQNQDYKLFGEFARDLPKET